MNLVQSLRSQPTEKRFSFSDYVNTLTATYSYGGQQYTLPVQFTLTGKKQLPIPNQYIGMVGAWASNSSVFAVQMTRCHLISQARFQFRDKQTGKLFGTPALKLLETPWANGTTYDLLNLAELAAGLGGNCYLHRDGDRLRWLRPDWVQIVLGSGLNPDNPAFAMDAEVVGYIYSPTLATGEVQSNYLPMNEVAHWTPIPDPVAPWRGMSWMQPVVREIMADQAGTDHKLAFFENAGTPNMVVKFPESIVDPEQFDKLVDAMEASHSGARNAYKTLYLAAGADASVVGVDLGKMAFTSLQGGGEVRIAVAGGVPASVAGFNEALKGSSLNTGNFQAARRLFADLFGRPQWASICSAFAKLVSVPLGCELWYSERDIAFLREDQQVEAEMQATRSTALMTLINAGYEPDAAVEFVQTNDVNKLMGHHTGLVPVQLLPPNVGGDTDSMDDAAEPPPDERQEGLDIATAAQRLAPAVGVLLDATDARGVLIEMGADIEPDMPDSEDSIEPAETPGEAPDPEDIAEPPEPGDTNA